MLLKSLSFILAALFIAAIYLQIWRLLDERRASLVWIELMATADEAPAVFNEQMVDGLPETAKRYFLFAIKPGASLRTVAEIKMRGQIGLGTKEEPKYAPLRARQVLAPPAGLVWRMKAGPVSGSDGLSAKGSWTRFWLFRLVPIVRVRGDVDHQKSAFGRAVAEGVFWTPAAFLPQNGVKWEEVDENTVRATVTFNGMIQTVDVTIDDEGRPIMVVLPRWSNANPEQAYQVQPFGGFMSEFREFDGYMLPTRVEGGNFIGTDAYFPFYKVEIENIRLH